MLHRAHTAVAVRQTTNAACVSARGASVEGNVTALVVLGFALLVVAGIVCAPRGYGG